MGDIATYLTGSCPPCDQGLQRRMRHAPISDPLMMPYFLMASYVYWLQVGLYRHTRIRITRETQL